MRHIASVPLHRSAIVHLSVWMGLTGVLLGLAIGILSGLQPLLLLLTLVGAAMLVCLATRFEATIIALLVIRSALDIFSEQQIPAIYAVGIDALTLAYVGLLLLARRPVQTDRFWWFLAGWLGLQSLWVILLPFGALGLGSAHIPTALREWVRISSWPMIYLLVMQLKGRIHPETLMNWIFLSLPLPMLAALMQVFVPSLLPPLLLPLEDPEGSRIAGTLGHPNTFAVFLVFFVGLTVWKVRHSAHRWFWLVLLVLLVFLLTTPKTLVGLAMFGVLMLIIFGSRLSLPALIGGVALFGIVIALFASTEFGQERLASIANTPLLNRNIDISRSVLMSWYDNNSFNWRLAQWTFLLQAWHKSPILGYGLQSSPSLTVLNSYAHNDYIRALAEGGVVGFSAFIGFITAIFWRLSHLFRSALPGSAQRDLCLTLIAFLIALLVGMCTENIWSHTTLYFIWWSVVAVAGWDWQPSSPEETSID